MLKIKDRVISYNTPKASFYMDYSMISTKENERLINMREKFIESVYKLLKSEEFKGFYIKHDEQIDVNIHIKHDVIEIEY